ncbi:MAG: mechanosensitive ion channel family protein [Oscillospiraceae bacterium]|nr:mechanosensitive ion channel family protein [Oscillospiraceae bacterium]
MDTAVLEKILYTGWGKLTVENLLSALVTLLLCLGAVRLVTTLARRALNRTRLDGRIKDYVLQGLRFLLYTVTALIVAESLGIPASSLVALLSVFALAVSLAVQDVLSNVAGGLVLLFSKPFTLGDYIESADGEGTVYSIGLTHTVLDTYGGQRVMLPNSRLTAGKIVNYTARGVRRVDHAVSASYEDSTQAVRAACLKAVSRTPHVLEDPPPQVVVTAYGESAIEYHVRFWAPVDAYWDACNSSLEAIRDAFREDGVSMTYNHLNVHIVDNTKEK